MCPVVVKKKNLTYSAAPPLRNATTGRFQQLTYSSFSLAFILNAVFMVTGFLTFGGMSKGLILNNYATSDVLATGA
jgi:amino acid permease